MYRQPYGRKEINTLDHVVANNLKTNKDQLNEAIKNCRRLILTTLIYLAVLATPYQ